MPPSARSSSMMKVWGVYGAIALVVLALVWFVYSQYQSNTENEQQAVAEKAATDTAKSENPFQAANPLSNVESDPFEKTKKVLNPFEQ